MLSGAPSYVFRMHIDVKKQNFTVLLVCFYVCAWMRKLFCNC